MTLRPKHATPKNFADFGSVALRPSGKPTSQSSDYTYWSDLAHYQVGGETEIGVCTVFARRGPSIEGMERHLRTPEVLIPIDAPFVVPLLHDGLPSTQPRAFRVDVGEAVVIAEGIWHGACLPVGKKTSSYFVVFRRGTPGEDVEKKAVEPFKIALG